MGVITKVTCKQCGFNIEDTYKGQTKITYIYTRALVDDPDGVIEYLHYPLCSVEYYTQNPQVQFHTSLNEDHIIRGEE